MRVEVSFEACFRFEEIRNDRVILGKVSLRFENSVNNNKFSRVKNDGIVGESKKISESNSDWYTISKIFNRI